MTTFPTFAPIKVGLIGYGFSGRTFHAPLIRSVDGLDLTMIASSDADKVQADFPGGIAVVADPVALATAATIELVVIASPNDSHAPLAAAALAAGKHVVVDKPFTLHLAEARRLADTARRHDRIVSVFHNRRFDSDYLSVKQAVSAGLIGAVTHFESHIDRFRPVVRDRWRERDGPGSGLWFDLGPHLVDQALQLFGVPDRVTADLAGLRAGARSDDWAHVVFDYPAHRVVLHASLVAAGGTTRFFVHGDRGSIVKREADPQERQLLGGMEPGGVGWGVDPDPLQVYDAQGVRRDRMAVPGDQRRFYSGLVEAVRGAAANPVPPIEAIAVMACIDAASCSSRTHRSVVPALDPAERAALVNGVSG